jgi:hypothetical protein
MSLIAGLTGQGGLLDTGLQIQPLKGGRQPLGQVSRP